MTDRLERFVAAQSPVIERVRAELRVGRKTSHWMWFVFPQIAGLGRSDMARTYAIVSLDEAHAYLAHRVLGPRLVECTGLVLAADRGSAGAIFGTPDDMKFHSSMTLFGRAAAGETSFERALARYFDGVEDPATVERLG